MITPQSSRNPGGPTGVGGKLFVSVFFLFFFGMGLLFVVLIAQEAVAGLRTWTWKQTPCEILQSAVTELGPRGRKTGDYYPQVQYRYGVGDQTYDSDRYTLKARAFSDYSKAERIAAAYPAGSHTICYVNPAIPAQAVLERSSLLFPLLALFPLIFVGIGAIGIYSAWRPASVKPDYKRPISDRGAGAFAQRFTISFFGLFMVIALGLGYALSIRPAKLIASARSWPAIPCTILSSEVRTHKNSHGGNTYSVNILYSYVFNDHPYRANRYDFMGGSSSGYNGKAAIVSRYSPGTSATCFVNPSDPTQAVLERGFTPMMWIGLLPFLFFVAGLFGMVSTLRKQRAQALPLTDPQAAITSPVWNDPAGINLPGTSAVLSLQPKTSPATKFFGAVLISLFWNGIVSVFVFQIFKGWRSHSFEWFLTLFMIPFVLVGLGMLAAMVYFFLALFNPRPRLTLRPGSPRLGESLRIEWEITGRLEALQNLRMQLEGREEATYSRGTRTATDANVFARLEIAATTAQQEMRSGGATLTMPADTMHSFSARHNKITWTIRVEGEIARWPDLQEEFNVTVMPALARKQDV